MSATQTTTPAEAERNTPTADLAIIPDNCKIPEVCNVCLEKKKFTLPGIPIFSTATLPGLVQSYVVAEQVLPFFTAMPERLDAALNHYASRDRSIFFLQKGAKVMNCLECLQDGRPEAVDYATMLLRSLACELFKEAEKEGAA